MKFFSPKFWSLVAASLFGAALQAQVEVTATAGTATATYTTVNAAFAAINAGTHQGAISLLITANTSEPATPTALLASGQGAANYNSVLIQPSSNVVIEGSTTQANNRGVLEFDGADSVTIDGNASTGPVERNLTIRSNAPTTTGSACVRFIGRTTGGLGTEYCTVRNCILEGSTSGNNGISGSTVTATYGIYAGSTTLSASGGANYRHLTFENNLIYKAYNGIFVWGLTTSAAQSIQVLNNVIGSNTDTLRIGFRGVSFQQVDVATISANHIFGIHSDQSVAPLGIEVAGTASVEVNINRNTIHDILQASGANGAYGINITNGANHFVVNNLIYNIMGSNSVGTGTTAHPAGLRITGGTGHQVYYNSVHLYGNMTGGSTTTTRSAAFLLGGSYAGMDIRNNIFANTMTSTATDAEHLALWISNNNFDSSVVTFDRNAYWIASTARHFVGLRGSAYGVNLDTTLAQLQARMLNNTNSVSAFGHQFTANDNLRIPAGTSSSIESGAVAVAFFTTDFDGLSRPAFGNIAPDMGAFEFNGINPVLCQNVNLSISSGSISCVGASDGESIATVTGANGTVSYLWNTGATTSQISNLTPGIYRLTITDAANCVLIRNTTVSNVTPLSGGFIQDNVSCFGGNNGALELLYSGGTGSLSYAWNTGATTVALTGLSAGVYSFTVTDANGCTDSVSGIMITEPAVALSLTLMATDATSAGNDGQISTMANGGVAPYDYLWSNGATTDSLNNLAAGTYVLTLTDAAGCQLIDSIEVEAPVSIRATAGAEQALISPNPSNGVFFVQGLAQGQKRLTLFNALGQALREWETAEVQVQAQFEYLPQGLYYLRIETTQGTQTLTWQKR